MTFKIDQRVFTPDGEGWLVAIETIDGYPVYFVQEGTIVTGYFWDEIS